MLQARCCWQQPLKLFLMFHSTKEASWNHKMSHDKQDCFKINGSVWWHFQLQRLWHSSRCQSSKHEEMGAMLPSVSWMRDTAIGDKQTPFHIIIRQTAQKWWKLTARRQLKRTGCPWVEWWHCQTWWSCDNLQIIDRAPLPGHLLHNADRFKLNNLSLMCAVSGKPLLASADAVLKSQSRNNCQPLKTAMKRDTKESEDMFQYFRTVPTMAQLLAKDGKILKCVMKPLGNFCRREGLQRFTEGHVTAVV